MGIGLGWGKSESDAVFDQRSLSVVELLDPCASAELLEHNGSGKALGLRFGTLEEGRFDSASACGYHYMHVQVLDCPGREGCVAVADEHSTTIELVHLLKLFLNLEYRYQLIITKFVRAGHVFFRNDEEVKARIVFRRFAEPGETVNILNNNHVVRPIDITKRTTAGECVGNRLLERLKFAGP